MEELIFCSLVYEEWMIMFKNKQTAKPQRMCDKDSTTLIIKCVLFNFLISLSARKEKIVS